MGVMGALWGFRANADYEKAFVCASEWLLPDGKADKSANTARSIPVGRLRAFVALAYDHRTAWVLPFKFNPIHSKSLSGVGCQQKFGAVSNPDR